MTGQPASREPGPPHRRCSPRAWLLTGFVNLLSQLENFKLFGFIYLVYLKKFELFLGLVIGEESLWFDNGICLGAAPSGPSGPSDASPRQGPLQHGARCSKASDAHWRASTYWVRRTSTDKLLNPQPCFVQCSRSGLKSRVKPPSLPPLPFSCITATVMTSYIFLRGCFA